MQQLLIEVSHLDQVFVEDICTKYGYTLSSFFVLLLDDYKKREWEKTHNDEEQLNGEGKSEEKVKESVKRGKRKKISQ